MRSSDYEETQDPQVKHLKVGVLCALAFFAALMLWATCLWYNPVSDIQILQGVGGDILIRRDGGYCVKFFPSSWSYEKRTLEICSKEGDGDAPKMQFANTSTGYLNCQIGYSIADATDAQIMAMHQYAQGDSEKLWQKVWTKLQTKAQVVASQYTPTDVVKNFKQFALDLHSSIVHNPELLKEGIDITFFDCAGLPKFDTDTEKQLDRQKAADLQKRNAEAEKIQLEAEKLKAVAQYEREMAEQEGKAKAQMAKEVQDAERQKKLAEIEAQKKVEVEKLAKEQLLVQMNKEREAAAIEVAKQKEVAEIEAQKKLSVAEINRKTEAANLEVIRLQAEQKVASAQAKQKEIELSGAITESEKVRLEYDMNTKVECAKAYAQGIGNVKLPQMWMTGGSKDGGAANPIELLINMMSLEKLTTLGANATPASGAKAK